LVLAAALCGHATGTAAETRWVATYGCGLQLTEPGNVPPVPGLASNTLRQVVRTTLGGKRLRVRFSNAYGTNAVVLNSVHVALNTGATATDAINPATDTPLTFQGEPSVTIPAGAAVACDPFDFDLPPLTNLTITTYFGGTSGNLTGHPGSRTTSYITTGNAVTSPTLPGAVKTAHWYFLAGVDVQAGDSSAALVILGDSITDGRGSTTDANNRWPDDLAGRLATNPATAQVSVINMGIGGNGIFGGLGPSVVRRFDRDVLDQNGVRWVILFEGVNDIGGSRSPAIATNLVAAYQQFITKAHARNLRVYGATITPFGGNGYYTPAHEIARQTVNAWIRTNQLYDAVIDFDAAVRDPATLTNLQSACDCGDHLHLSPAGYHTLADAVDLNLFKD
jgi:lysophospholipase L1-like esterase